MIGTDKGTTPSLGKGCREQPFPSRLVERMPRYEVDIGFGWSGMEIDESEVAREVWKPARWVREMVAASPRPMRARVRVDRRVVAACEHPDFKQTFPHRAGSSDGVE